MHASQHVCFLVATALLLGCGHGERLFSITDRDAVVTVLDAQEMAWNRGDIIAFMDGYVRSKDLVFTSGGQIRRGFDETLAKYKRSYADKGAMGKLDFELIELRALGPDSALVLGRWKLTETPKAGGGIFSLVVVRTPAGWRVIHDHTSISKKK